MRLKSLQNSMQRKDLWNVYQSRGKMRHLNMQKNRVCTECLTRLQITDKRFEVQKISFQSHKGIKREIIIHLCQTCFDIILGGVGYDDYGKIKSKEE